MAALLGETVAQDRPARIGVVLPAGRDGFRLTANSVSLAAEAARTGTVLAEEEFANGTGPLAAGLELLDAIAPDGDTAFRAAQRLVAREEVFALVGGFADGQARALSRVADEHGILFFNIGSASDELRGPACERHTFHVEASAAMYLDALAFWFSGRGSRSWCVIHAETDQGIALAERAVQAVGKASGGGGEVRLVSVPEAPIYDDALAAIRDAEPDVVLLLLDWRGQLEFLGRFEASAHESGEPALTGFPAPVTQTREFFLSSRNSAPRVGTGHRIALWDPRLTSGGADRLNSRYFARWGRPMDPPAWAGHSAVTMLVEAVAATGSLASSDIIAHLERPESVFDVNKGSAVSFRGWDHQLRQPLYAVKIDPFATDLAELGEVAGVLPEPGSSGMERRLDELGVGRSEDSNCRFA